MVVRLPDHFVTASLLPWNTNFPKGCRKVLSMKHETMQVVNKIHGSNLGWTQDRHAKTWIILTPVCYHSQKKRELSEWFSGCMSFSACHFGIWHIFGFASFEFHVRRNRDPIHPTVSEATCTYVWLLTMFHWYFFARTLGELWAMYSLETWNVFGFASFKSDVRGNRDRIHPAVSEATYTYVWILSTIIKPPRRDLVVGFMWGTPRKAKPPRAKAPQKECVKVEPHKQRRKQVDSRNVLHIHVQHHLQAVFRESRHESLPGLVATRFRRRSIDYVANICLARRTPGELRIMGYVLCLVSAPFGT